MLEQSKKMIYGNKWLKSLLYDTENIDQFQNIGMHEKMLADYIRLDAYAPGIRRAVKPGDVVLDLGCGTGILSMFAAQSKPEVVYALDHSAIIELAKRVAHHNKFDNIQFFNVNSRTFTPEKPVDVIVHEQMGSFLFDENMLENLFDLKRRCLKPGGQIVPAKFELYLEPVCLKRDYRHAFIWENEIHGVDYSFLKDDPTYKTAYAKEHSGEKVHKEPRTQIGALEYYLCEPSPILTVDLNTLDSADDLPKTLVSHKTVVRDGDVDGVSIYFKTSFDDDISFTTGLDNPNTNWRPPFFRLPRRACSAGDVLALTLKVDNFHDVPTWAITLEKAPS